MKRCPQCQRIYSDETLNYCLEDGASLFGDVNSDDPATAILTPPPPATEAATRTLETSKKDTGNAVSSPGSGTAEPVGNYRRMITIVGAALIVALGIGGYWLYGSRASTQISAIAVLPFENESGDAELDYLSDGVSESVIDRLSQISQLKVIARNSSFQYRGRNQDFGKIANALGVEALVTGRVVRQGDNYSIRVEMIDARENRNLWSESFVRKAGDVQALQSDISKVVADNLRLRLTGTQTEQLGNAGTANPEAYEMLLRGRYYVNKVGTENRAKAAEYFQQAIDLDTNYALAYAELSLTYVNLVGFSNYDPKEYLPRAEQESQKAVELNQDLPEAVYSKAAVMRYLSRWSEADQAYRRAIDLGPNLARTHNGYALFLSLLGRHDEAVAEIKRAREFDPVSVLINLNMGVIYYEGRRYDEAIETLQKTLELDPNVPFAHLHIGLSYSEKGVFGKAIESIQQAIKLNEDNPKMQIRLGQVYAKSGDDANARTILSQVKASKQYVSPAELAMLYASLGDKESALASLENAFRTNDVQLQYIKIAPAYDNLRSDPRFKDLLKRVGLPD